MASAEPEILSHWSTLIDGLDYSSRAFYESLEATIEGRAIPKSKTSTHELSEGGVLSAKRLYFRVQRGDHTFDICAAPFGRGFFVSWWLLALPGCLARLPIVGFLVRRFAKPLTYYSIDTALMFQEAVRKAVEEVIDEITTAKGLRALSESERKPIMRDFFER